MSAWRTRVLNCKPENIVPADHDRLIKRPQSIEPFSVDCDNPVPGPQAGTFSSTAGYHFADRYRTRGRQILVVCESWLWFRVLVVNDPEDAVSGRTSSEENRQKE